MENEILVYKTDKGTVITDSRKVARKFGKDHKMVLRAIRNLTESAQYCADYKWFYETTYIDERGREQPGVIMTRDGFSLLAMGFTGDQALKFKVDFIKKFNEMEQALSQAPAIPQTLSEALRLAADQAEQIEQQQKQLEEQKPRVLFSQAVETSKGSVLVSEIAKIIRQNGVETGEKRLFDWLRSNGYLCTKGEKHNEPTQWAMEMGLFEIKKTTISKPDGTVFVTTTPKVTGRGAIYIVEKFLKGKRDQEAFKN